MYVIMMINSVFYMFYIAYCMYVRMYAYVLLYTSIVQVFDNRNTYFASTIIIAAWNLISQ